MKLNHDIYREAMENVRISDKTGKELLELAAQQNRRHKKAFKTQMAAAIAAILAISLGVNGICYAQTGKNVLEMFAALYDNTDSLASSKTYSTIAEGANKSGESIACNNLKFTLDYYFYDRKNGEVYFAVRTDSLDNTPLDMERVNEHYTVDVKEGSSGTGNWNSPIYNDARDSAIVYYHYMLEADGEGNFPEKINFTIDHIIADDSQALQYDMTYDTEELGAIAMSPTGELKARYADCSFLPYCDSKAKITSGGFVLYFDEDIIEDEAFHTDKFFPFIEIKMKDGVTYRIGKSAEEKRTSKTVPLYDVNGKLANPEDFSPEEAKTVETYTGSASEKPLPENVYHIAGSYGFGGGAEGYSVYSATFHDYFIDVDDIAEVYIDNVKVSLE